MQDLNDIFYFSEVVGHGGFAAAGRALRVPKSKLSRRVARLGVRLIERSSRRFRVTDIGQSFYDNCRSALGTVERAEAQIAAVQAEPRGPVRFSCPTGLLELVSPMLPGFLRQYPRVNIHVVATDRPIDLIAEHVDVALRVRVALTTDSSFAMRTLGHSRRILLASPAFANSLSETNDIAALAALPTLGSSEDEGSQSWELESSDGRSYRLEHEPRLGCTNFPALKDAAIAGLGVAFIPDHIAAEALRAGRLVRLFPAWRGEEGIVHLVFTGRTGLPAQVRAWIDHLAEGFRDRTLFEIA